MPESHSKKANLFKLALPRIVFGTTSLGNLFVQPSVVEKQRLIQTWLQTMPSPIAIDTAGKYGAGLALEVLGRELQELGVDPNDVIISNKLGWRRVTLVGSNPTFEPDVWLGLKHDALQDISYQGIRRCWEEGCELLGNYRPQMLSVHDPDEYLAAASDTNDRKRRLEDVVSAYQSLYELRDSGQANAIGIGCKDWRIVRELDRLCRFDWVMLANSYTIMSHPDELIDFMDSLTVRQIPIINSAVLHGGFLSGGKFFDYRTLEIDNKSDSSKIAWRESFFHVCQLQGVDPFDVAVAYGLSHRGIQSIALSTSRPERVKSLVSAVTKTVPINVWEALLSAGLLTSSSMVLNQR